MSAKIVRKTMSHSQAVQVAMKFLLPVWIKLCLGPDSNQRPPFEYCAPDREMDL